jgi:hypothetical protein
MQNYKGIPSELFIWITYLAEAVPLRSVPTFIELLIGSMLTQTGFVTEAWLAVNMKRQWFSYYKWLERGKWSWVALGRQTGRLVARCLGSEHLFLVIDDFIVLRASKKAPNVSIHYQHSRKPNRPRYVRGQTWVTLSVVAEKDWANYTVPLLSRLARKKGNTSKLRTALVLLRAVRGIFKSVTLLIDSWYMRAKVILPLLAQNIHVIGQVRKDTALFMIPENIPGKRGRKRKYGEKYTPEQVEKLRRHQVMLYIYGKKQWLRYRSTTVRVRFLKGVEAIAVWVQFEDKPGQLSKPSLLLCTDTTLHPMEVIQRYAKRWSTEPMFNQLIHRWGVQQTWQQNRQVLHRWVQICSLAYVLPLLLAVKAEVRLQNLIHLTPWRMKQPITAGRVRLGLQRILRQVAVRDWWNSKSRKFKPPELADFELFDRAA